MLDVYERTVASELSRLQLDKLETDWTKEVIENDFLQCQDIPISYEEILEECNINARFKNVKEALFQWLELNKKTVESGEDSSSHTRQSLGSLQEIENISTANGPHNTNSGANFWAFLFQKENVNIDKLLALVGFLIDRGSNLASSPQDRKHCFAAANLYLTMICIPGSMAFRVYHQMLYLKTFQLIQLYVKTSKYENIRTGTPVQRKKDQCQPTPEVEDEDAEAPIGAEDIAVIENALPAYMETLKLVAQHLSLKRYPSILKETVESMLPVISLNKGAVSLKALEIVQNFCQPLHGDVVQIVHHVFVHILPYLTLDPSEKDLNNRNLIALKDVSFNLVRSFISKFGEAIYPLVLGLIKHVCIDVVDRAEYRQRTAHTALDLLQLIPEDRQQEIIRWFLLLAHAEQAFLRLFSMEILSLLLQNGRIDILTFAVIFGQCSDPSATVRAKALSILGECLESNDQSIVEMFNIIFYENPERQMTEETEDDETDILELLQGEEPIDVTPALLPRASEIMNLLKERAVDDKVHVRKNALQLLLSVARRHGRYLNQDLLRLLGNACRDVALLIRRHMVQMLTELVFENPQNEIVLNVWARSVLPLVLDGETRVQEKALECADQLILRSLISREDQLGWAILDVIIEQGLDTYLSKAVEMWSRQQQIPGQLTRTLLSNTEERCRAAMTLIAIIARHMPIENNIKKFSIDYLQENIGSKDPMTIYCIQQVYKILGASLSKMTKDQIQTIRALSARFVANFQLPTNLISTACDMVVFCIQQQIEDENDARKVAAEWAAEILACCGEYLSNHLRKQESVLSEEEEQLARRIFTLGCVALHSPQAVNKRHFLMLQHSAFQPESGVDAPIPFSQPQSQPTRRLPPRLQAASIISLGKLSVQHEEMAKQLIPGLGRLLETTPHEAIRNNIVCILCDWVVRYATAIDPVMPQVTACLRDPILAVRKQTLVLLIHLLQEDYLKIRGTFFFRILQLACDDDEGLRELALFYVTQRLLHRQPTIIQQHFIECVFHFNDYKGHPTYNKFALTERERKLFSIAGPQNARRRFQIYQFMLQNLDDEARFQLTFRLTRDVLHGVVEEVMSLKNASTEAVLKDVLSVLSSEDIKLASLAASTDDDPVDKEDIAQAIVQSTKKAIIAQVVKRNVIENVVPIVVALKRKLAMNKSPLMGNLMQFLRELMKDYKDEVQEILAQDRQLMAEIDFDLKRFEQQEKLDATLQTENRSDHSVPPPELVNANVNETSRPAQQTDRRSRIKGKKGIEQPLEVSNNVTRDVQIAIVKESDKAGASKPIENDQPSTEEQEGQEPANAEETLVPTVNVQKQHEKVDDKVEQDEIARNDSLPSLESSSMLKSRRTAMPPPKRTSARLLRPRIMSTPIRNIPIDEVSFQIRDLDVSDIPQVETKTNKRQRR